MPWAIPILVSLAISFAFTAIARLIQPQQQRFTGGVQPNQTVNQPGTTVTLRNPAPPHQIIVGETRVQGDITFMQDSDDKWNLNLIVTWAGHEVESLGKLYFNEEEVTVDGSGFGTGKWSGFVYVSDHLGSSTQTADADLMARLPGVWTAEHRGRGRAYSYIRIYNDPKIFPNGLPNMWRVAKGMKFYDHRSGLTAWTDNASLVQAGYLAHPKYGIGAVHATEQDLDALDAAASDCEDTITLSDGGTERRYTCNGAWRCDRLPADVIPELLSASYGTLVLVGGKWTLRPGVYEEPTLTFGEKHFRAPFTLRNLLGAEQSFNGIKGTYRNPEKNYQKDDWPAVRSSAYVTEDGGEEKFHDGDFPFTTSASMAQRLGRIELRQARQSIRFTAQLNCSGLRIVSGSTIGFDDPLLGWSNKPFRVIELRMVFGQIDLPSGGKSPTGIIGVDVDVRETSSSIYDWTSSDEVTVDPAPNSSLPDVFNVIPITNLSIGDELYETAGGVGVRSKMTATWEPSADAFASLYQVEFKPHADSDYQVLALIPGTSWTIFDLADGDYDLRIAAVNRIGTVSPYVAVTHTVAGLSSPPTSMTGFGGAWIGGAVHLSWDKSPDLDVIHGGAVEIRHSPATSGATWATSTPIGSQEIPGAATSAFLPGKAGTYLARFRDARESGGNLSNSTATWVTDQQVALSAFNILDGLVEDPTFAGTKTQCSVVSSKLRIIPGKSVAQYDWSAKIDLGLVKRCRLTIEISAAVVNYTDLVSAWPSIAARHRITSAVSGKEAWARTYVRTTNDDPASGGATWSFYRLVDSAEFQCRGFQLRTDLTAQDTSFGIEIEGLLALVEELA